MKKKLITTLKVTIIVTLIFIIIKFLIWGVETEYIADYMPPTNVKNITIDFIKVATGTTMLRLFLFTILNMVISIIYTKIAFKRNIYTNKKDRLYSLILFFVPLIVCFCLIFSQLSYTV